MRAVYSAIIVLVAPYFAFGQSAVGYTIGTVAGNGTAGYAGDGSAAAAAELSDPFSAATDSAGNLYIADWGNARIRKVAISSGVITTVAGNGTQGYSGDNGLATSAELNYPIGVAVDSAGNLYIADTFNHRIRKVTASSGAITTVAGNGAAGYLGDGGSATSAELAYPYSVAVDASGNLYIADYGNNRIREVSAGVITTIAGTGTAGFSGDGGSATSAQISQPSSVALDSSGNLYFADYGNDRIRRISKGAIFTVAGNGSWGFSGDGGPATSAQLYLYKSSGVTVDAGGNLYIADTINQRIREVTSGVILTIAGTGSEGYGGDGGASTGAELNDPTGVAVSPAGIVYIADLANSRVRSLTPSGPACSATVSPLSLSPGSPGGVFNLSIETSAPACYWAVQNLPAWITIPGSNIGSGPATVTLVVAADSGAARAAAISIAGVTIQVSQSSPPCSYSLSGGGQAFTVAGGSGSLGVTAAAWCPWTASSPASWVTITGGASGLGNGTVTFSVAANTGAAQSAALTVAGLPFVVAQGTGVTLTQSFNLSTLAGNGTPGFAGDGGAASGSELNNPVATAADAVGNVYIADKYNHRVRKVSHGTGTITTVAGSGVQGYAGDGGPATAAQLSWPSGVALDAAGNLYIGDAGNNVVRKVSLSTGIISTVAGDYALGYGYSGDGAQATGAQLNYPTGVAVNSTTGALYIADSANNAVRMVSGGVISTVVGKGPASNGGAAVEGYIGDGGPATSAEVAYPQGLAVDSFGNLYIADSLNYAVRWVNNGVINTLAGNGTQGYLGDGAKATAAELDIPGGIALDAAGNLYIADSGNDRVRYVSNGAINTLAGNGTQGFSGDGGAAASGELASPLGVSVDSSGNVYIADSLNNRIRLATPTSSTCTTLVNPVELFPTAGGGTIPVSIATGASCAWSVQNLPSWITVSGSASGSGVASVSLVVAADTGAARSANITVAGITIPVNQTAPACSYSLTYGGQSFPAAGGAGSVGVAAPAYCSWSVSNTLSWVTVTSATSGAGNATVTFQVAANSGPAQAANMTIAGIPYEVEQAGSASGQLPAAGSMAQLAAGGGWNTTITLVNNGATSAEVVLNFFNDQGNALPLPLTLPQGSVFTSSAPLLASSIDQTIAAGAELVIKTVGAPGQASVEGWAQLLTNGTVGGSAVFADTTAAGTQEAVAPLETRNPTSFTLPFNYTSGYQTGVALANLTGTSLSVPVTLLGPSGASLGPAAPVTLPPYGHTSFMLAGEYAAVAAQYGSMELGVPSGAQISALGIRAAPDGALTTVPVFAAGDPSNGSMAQVASGGPWNTTFTLVNTSATAAAVTLDFYSDSGAPVQLPVFYPLSGSLVVLLTSNFTQTIAPGAQVVIATDGSATQATTEGWAQLQVTGGAVGGSAVFADTTAAGVQEAIVPVETANANAYVLPFDYTSGYQTGIALANLTSQPLTVSVILRDSAGNTIGASSIPLTAMAHQSFMLATQFPVVSGIYGTMELDTPGVGQVTALGIRATPAGAITSVPVLVK